MPASEIESKPLREKLLPQTSIRFLFALMTVSALFITVLQMSAETTAYWTKLLVLVVMTTFACFSAYVVMFVLGSLVSKATEPLVAVIESSDTKNTLTYSTDNPSTSPHTQANPSASSNEQEASQ